MKSNAWKTLLKYGLGVVALTWVVVKYWNPRGPDDPGLSGLIERPLHFGPIVLAALIACSGLVITFLRWHLLVRAVGLEFSRADAVRLGFLGYFFGTFIPAVGADLVKAYYIARDQSQKARAVATVAVDRALGLWALAAFVSIVGGFFWLSENPLLHGPACNEYLQMIVRTSIVLSATSLLVFVVVGFLSSKAADWFASALGNLPKVGQSLAEFWRACWMYRQKTRAVLLAVLLSLVGHLGWVCVFHLAIQAFETPNPRVDIGSFSEHMIVVPVGMTVQALFPAPGGVGGGEAAYGELYGILGKPKANGVAGSLSQRFIFLGLAVVGYLFFSPSRKKVVLAEEKAETEQSACKETAAQP